MIFCIVNDCNRPVAGNTKSCEHEIVCSVRKLVISMHKTNNVSLERKAGQLWCKKEQYMVVQEKVTGYYAGKFIVNTLSPRQNGRHLADIFNAFSRIQMYEFRLIFHWSLFRGVQITIFQHIGLDNDLALTMWQAIIWTKDCEFTDEQMRHLIPMSWW